MSEMIEAGLYRHINGNDYEVLMIARNSNDCEQQMVIYKSLQNSDFPAGTIWVRPLNDFMKPGRFTRKDEVKYRLVTTLANIFQASPNQIIDRLTGLLWDEEEAGKIKRVNTNDK